jgi:hypothetical protein
MDAIQAVCGLISTTPGVANTTNLAGHLPQPIKCAHCDAEYHIDYTPNDLTRVRNYEPRLRAAAQRLIDANHPKSARGAHWGFIHLQRLN